jgi:hypothetical protein
MSGLRPTLSIPAKRQRTLQSGTGTSCGCLQPYLSNFLRTMPDARPSLKRHEPNTPSERESITHLWHTMKATTTIFGNGCSSHLLQFSYPEGLMFHLTFINIRTCMSCRQVKFCPQTLPCSSSMASLAVGERSPWAC